ncbi:ficolin-2-like [Physella acuta]|uniref:ficolin-2-like n=1 Tax=Physella acuta TaxID=109671 RepID=UPI0027DD8EEB|nr:ficolin-2-like [Physella acuta]
MALFLLSTHTTIFIELICCAIVFALDVSTCNYYVYNQSEVLMLPLGKQLTNVDLVSCGGQCLVTNTCFSFAYNKVTRSCFLGSGLIPYNNTVESLNTKVYSVGLIRNSSALNYVTLGKNPTFDPFNPNVYKSCRDVISNEPRKVVTLTSGLVVMCDTVTDGGGWTIFQRRVSGTVIFYRGWEEYKRGFGDYGIGEFYLGNENIFSITSKATHELRIDLVYNGTYYAKYSRFKLSSETELYTLSISGYTGNAGDSLRVHNNRSFSTLDRDNDAWGGHCAVVDIGAWWYRSCHDSNLNGQWGNTNYGPGLNWFTLTGHYSNVQLSEMKMRTIV